MPPGDPNGPKVARITVAPADAMVRPGIKQRLAVTAHYTDGTTRDVTRDAQFSSSLDTVAAVDEHGLVRGGKGRGEAVVMVRYMSQVAVCRAVAPYDAPSGPLPAGTLVERNYVDKLAAARWRKRGWCRRRRATTRPSSGG